MTARHVPLGEPDHAALLAADGDLVAQKRHNRRVTFVVGDDELIHRIGPRAVSLTVSRG